MVIFEGKSCPAIDLADDLRAKQYVEDRVNQEVEEKARFEALMADGVKAHNNRDNLAALTCRLEAYDCAKLDSIDKGRAARDISATFDKLGVGYEDDADQWAKHAYEIHESHAFFNNEPPREVLRELSASAMYMAIRTFRKYKRAQEIGLESNELLAELLEYAHEAYDKIQDAKELAVLPIDQEFDQYEINEIRRLALFEALYGTKKQAKLLGKKAVGCSFMSESPRLESSTQSLNMPDRLRAKNKALIGGLGSLAVVGIKSFFGKSKTAHNFSEALTSRIV